MMIKDLRKKPPTWKMKTWYELVFHAAAKSIY